VQPEIVPFICAKCGRAFAAREGGLCAFAIGPSVVGTSGGARGCAGAKKHEPVKPAARSAERRSGSVNVNATDVAAVAEDALIVLVWCGVDHRAAGMAPGPRAHAWVCSWGFRLLRERLHRP